MGFVVILILIILGFVAYKAYRKIHRVGASPVSKAPPVTNSATGTNRAAAPDNSPEPAPGKAAKSSLVPVLGSLAKSLVISGAVITACIVVMLFNMTIGTILMLVYSGWLVVRAYHQQFPLTFLTCFLPIFMALGCYGLQLAIFELSELLFVMLAGAVGALIGLIVGRSHHLTFSNGLVLSKRTWVYLLVWALAHGVTQVGGMMGLRNISDFGLIAGAFSTANVVALHLVLWLRRMGGGIKAAQVSMVASLLMPITGASLALILTSSSALAAYVVTHAQQASEQALKSSDFGINGIKNHRIDWQEMERNMRLPGGVTLSSLGFGSVFDLGINQHYAKLGSGLSIRSNLATVYMPAGIGFIQDMRFSAFETAVNGFVKMAQVAENAQSGGARYHIRSGFCGTNCVEISYECGYIALKSTGDWTTLYGLNLNFRSAAYGASDTDPSASTCRKYNIPNTGRRLFSLANQRLSSMEYQGGASNLGGGAAGAAGMVNALIQMLAAFGATAVGLAASSAAAASSIASGVASSTASSTASISASAAVSGAMSAAQEAANAAAIAGQDAANSSKKGDDNNWGHDSRTHSNGTLMLDGDEAIAWMDKNGYLDANGNKTKKFNNFMESMPSESGPGLQGIAMDVDKDGNPTYVIIVPDETAVENYQANDSSDTDEQHETTSDDDHDSSSDSDDEATTKTETSDTKPIEDNKVDTTDDSDEDEKDTTDKSTQDSKDKKTETNSTKPKPDEQQTPPIEYPNAKEDLEKVMDKIIKQKVGDKYYVRNPNLLSKAWNNTGGWLINEKIRGYKGGQCGDFAEDGKDWSRDDIKKLFGEDVYVTKILAREWGTYSTKKSAGGYFLEINHAATRVVLPNGEKYVLDYWEGMQDKKPAVYKEEDWIKKQKNNLDYFNRGVKIDYTPDETYDQDQLKDYIEKHGEKKGKEKYFKYQKNPTKARATIEAWEVDPW